MGPVDEESIDSQAGDSRPVPGRRVWLPRAALGLGVLILLFCGWLGFRAYQAYHHLSAARSVVAQLQTEVKANGVSQPEKLAGLATELQHDASSAGSAVDDPIFRAATALPWIGDNLQAVRQTSQALSLVADQMPEVATLAERYSQTQLLAHGAVDVDFIKNASTVVTQLDTAINRAIGVASSIDRSHLIGPVDRAVTQLQNELPQVSNFTDEGAKLAQIAAPMLGADGVRTYLVAFQNLAEVRATGGIFGSYVVLHMDNGKFKISGQGSASRDIGVFDHPIGATDEATRGLYGDRIGTYPMDVNFTPDFPAAAARFASMYKARTGTSVDGVVAIDPVVVATLLKGAAPVLLADGTELKSDSIVKFLLSDLYAKFPLLTDAPRRDTYTAAATARVFAAITGSGGGLKTTLGPVKKLINDRRILAWSADQREQDVLLGTPVAGRLDADAAGSPSVGVFLNDGTGGKLGYYLDAGATLTAGNCAADGTKALHLTVKLRDGSPSQGLSPYVIGGTNPAYQYRLNMSIFAPTNGIVNGVTVDGKTAPTLSGSDHGRAVSVVTVTLGPGRSATVTATILVPDTAASSVTPALVTTPLVRAWTKSTESYSACQ